MKCNTSSLKKTYELSNKNPLLCSSYNYYQGILKSIRNRDKNKFINIIHHFDKNNYSQYIIKTNKTFLRMEKYLKNSFDYELSNDIVEVINNLNPPWSKL